MKALWTILAVVAVAGGGYLGYRNYFMHRITIKSVDWLTGTVKYDVKLGPWTAGYRTVSNKNRGILKQDAFKSMGQTWEFTAKNVLGNITFSIKKNGKEVEYKAVDFNKQTIS